MKIVSRKWRWIGILCLLAGPVLAQEAKVTQLITKDLAGIVGKEGAMVTVEYPPGGSSSEHRHNAYTFVYVSEGSAVLQFGLVVAAGIDPEFGQPEDRRALLRSGRLAGWPSPGRLWRPVLAERLRSR